MQKTVNYKKTVYACYIGYITQAIINNLAPILFIIFRTSFNLSYEEVGRLILLNFGTQILIDLVAVKVTDRIGYRKCTVVAHGFCVLGLVFMGTLPFIMPPYLGLVISAMTYACGGGFIEVIISPIVESVPGDAKQSAMSLLHSFYCWGQVLVVLVSTILLQIIGTTNWFILPLIWATIPLFNMFNFMRVPFVELEGEHIKTMSLKELLSSRNFVIALGLMVCAGASEISMSQWSSIFVEQGLGVSKMLGDLLGPCLFAIFMGVGRVFYGIFGEKIKLKPALLFCGSLCVVCYALTVFSNVRFLSFLGCALCGLSVSLMWPGTISMSCAKFPRGGTVMFGFLAIAGDVGASLGPWMTGLMADISQKSTFFLSIGEKYNLNETQLGLKSGLLVAIIFPILLLVFATIFGRDKK